MKKLKFALCLMDVYENILSRREVSVISDVLSQEITEKVIKDLMKEAMKGET